MPFVYAWNIFNENELQVYLFVYNILFFVCIFFCARTKRFYTDYIRENIFIRNYPLQDK